ncbi:hypothetical protein M493_10677 [Geobacillus genomosp. 3]|uniref:Uncharacterized protein n=1 Tax=Geobacillus genomosp. 3 TaxID=1921421 RepID=V5LVR8_GEOG3|nr:hypothetical protein M493_10677 [Geobacillus genomosp. 3]
MIYPKKRVDGSLGDLAEKGNRNVNREIKKQPLADAMRLLFLPCILADAFLAWPDDFGLDERS